MSILVIRGRIGSNSRYTAVEEQGVPAWASDYNNYNNWWGGGDTYTGFYWSLVDKTGYIQYGKNADGWAGTRFIDETLTWTNEVTNPDGSVSCDVTVDVGNFRGKVTQYIKGPVPVVHTLKIGGQTVVSYSGGTGDTFNVVPTMSRITKHITIAPQGYADGVQLHFHAHYPTGIFPDADFLCGITLFNPTLPNYIPLATRKSGRWKNLNDNSGHIQIRRNSSNWEDKSKELYNSQRQPDQGHNRIRRSGKWLQAPKMTEN